MNEEAVIFVSLPDEAVDVWRPVRAERVRENIYRIIEQPYDRETERWEFEPGQQVACELVDAYEGPILAATSLDSS
jgi:hypothetical protein